MRDRLDSVGAGTATRIVSMSWLEKAASRSLWTLVRTPTSGILRFGTGFADPQLITLSALTNVIRPSRPDRSDGHRNLRYAYSNGSLANTILLMLNAATAVSVTG